MLNSIANLKENLTKIALDVHDDEELEIYTSPNRNGAVSSPDRRSSRGFASPFTNGFDSPHNAEIEQYKAEIKKLKESEAEIKALSVNYAALLKDKEDWVLRLNEENGLLKKNLNATRNLSRIDSLKTSTNSQNGWKGTNDQSPNRQQQGITKNRLSSNQTNNGFKHDQLSNGSAHDAVETMIGSQKDLTYFLEEKNKSLAATQANYESELKKVKLEVENERSKLAHVRLQLQEEQRLNRTFQEELKSLKMEKDKTNMEVNKLRNDMNQKVSEVSRLQMELNRMRNTEADDSVEGLKRVIDALEKENTKLKVEKVELEASLQTANNSSAFRSPYLAQENSDKPANVMAEDPQFSGSFPGKQEMELSLQNLEKELKEARLLKDKALQELNRLKKHLLDKENEESEKMDEDTKIIEELREKSEYQRIKIQQLEKALKQAMAGQEDAKMANHNELQRCREIIDELNRNVANFTSMMDAKNVELLNLQTALGQYYAEIEAKEHLEEVLAHAREESIKLAELLKDAHQREEVSRQEKETILEKLSQVERTQSDGRVRVNKLEEDNAKLRRALEQSMSRINRMSVDSDYFVDRRIVIKLLVTYFQRNHSREVLDLMVRMLGFSDEDKQRIGVAQQGSARGVVRGVLGLPGRLVGGIMGASPAGANPNMASDNQSFADLWVDFLLKETEERERRESEEANKPSKADQSQKSSNEKSANSPFPDHRIGNTAFSRSSPSTFLSTPISLRVDIPPTDQSDSEFSTVPLTSAEHRSQASRLLPRY